jgi:nucleoside-diphosphate-sugar epimerase
MSDTRVLVTGGSGFVAAHCILRLLADGYRVRTTVRSLAREGQVRAMLTQGGAEPGDRLEFVQADLLSDEGWSEAVAGCDYVLHVASPLPMLQPRNHDVLVRPAREGTLRVLKAAHGAGVRRVLLTSSFAAVGYGHPPREAAFTEADWTDPTAEGAYIKSKTLAEQAAWDFVAGEGKGLELATVNPVVILGPALDADSSVSVALIKALLNGRLPFLPRRAIGIVDVRDVADLHVRAMTDPSAKGERFLCVSGDFMTIQEIAQTLREELGAVARRIPTRLLPAWIIRAASLFSAAAREVAGLEGGKRKSASNAKARQMLGWEPRPPREAILATAESLIRLGLVKT